MTTRVFDTSGFRFAPEKSIKSISLPLASGTKAYRGRMACLDTVNNVVRPGAAGNPNLVPVGQFNQDVDASAGLGHQLVLVTLTKEIWCQWYASVTGSDAVTSSHLFNDVYISDDVTVTTDSASGENATVGRVWAIDPNRGVLVEVSP